MTNVAHKKQTPMLDPKLAKVATHLRALQSEQKQHGQEMQVALQEDRSVRFKLVEVVHHHVDGYEELLLVYEDESGDKLRTGFIPHDADGIKLRQYGIFGTDMDGEWVRVARQVQSKGLES